jgi:hypothetical protein
MPNSETWENVYSIGQIHSVRLVLGLAKSSEPTTDSTGKTLIVSRNITGFAYFAYSPIEGVDKVEVLLFEPDTTLTQLDSFMLGRFSSLKSICIPASVRRIVIGLFLTFETEFSPVESVTFEAGSQLEVIGHMAFAGCTLLESICLPPLVQFLDGLSLAGCGLRRITIDPQNRFYHIKDDVVVHTTFMWAIRYFGGDAEASIPDNVAALATGCFFRCRSVVRISFSGTPKVAWFQTEAFRGCALLESITIPSSVVLLGDGCFVQCTSLRTVSFCSDSKLSSIGINAFGRCTMLESMTLPPSMDVSRRFLRSMGRHCWDRSPAQIEIGSTRG